MVLASLILGTTSLVGFMGDSKSSLLVLHHVGESGIALSRYSMIQPGHRTPDYSLVFSLPKLTYVAEAVYDKPSRKIAVLGIDQSDRWNWFIGRQGRYTYEKVKNPPGSRILSSTFRDGLPLFFLEHRSNGGRSHPPLFEARFWRERKWTKALLSMPFDKPVSNRYTQYPAKAQTALDQVVSSKIDLYPVHESMGISTWNRLFGDNYGSTLGAIDDRTGYAVVQKPNDSYYAYLGVIAPKGAQSTIRVPAKGTISQLRIRNGCIFIQWSRGLAEALTTEGKQIDIVRSILIVDTP